MTARLCLALALPLPLPLALALALTLTLTLTLTLALTLTLTRQPEAEQMKLQGWIDDYFFKALDWVLRRGALPCPQPLTLSPNPQP